MPGDPAAIIAAMIDIWNGGPVERLRDLISADYRGHMLHLASGERDAASYPEWIQRSRAANPGVTYHIVEQVPGPERVVSRLEARRTPASARDGTVSRGINISLFDDRGLLAEEWAIWSPWLSE